MKDVRPTSGRVLSAMFSILGDRVTDAAFLDVFAGTGRVGLEALRRGADSCAFIESVRARADDIRRVAGDALVLALDVRRAVTWLMKREMRFDVIFADPPYCSGWMNEIVGLGLEGLVRPEGLIVIEHSVRESLNCDSFMTRVYGETCLTFMRPMT